MDDSDVTSDQQQREEEMAAAYAANADLDREIYREFAHSDVNSR
jgi:hypothetical protein